MKIGTSLWLAGLLAAWILSPGARQWKGPADFFRATLRMVPAACAAPATAPAAASQSAPPSPTSGYQLAFADDFNTLSLSPNGGGSYNWYNPGMYWEQPAPYQNIVVSNSALWLTWTPTQATSDTSVATCGPNAQTCRAWRYGYFEVRMKWDATTGAWPAIWFLPTQHITNPTGEHGEIDLFEAQGTEPNIFYGTVHDWVGSQSIASNANNAYNLGPNVDMESYHVYGVLWQPGKLTWYFDNQPLFSAPTYPIMDQQNYYLILGSQEGRNFQYGDRAGVTATGINVAIDWVHVWQP